MECTVSFWLFEDNPFKINCTSAENLCTQLAQAIYLHTNNDSFEHHLKTGKFKINDEDSVNFDKFTETFSKISDDSRIHVDCEICAADFCVFAACLCAANVWVDASILLTKTKIAFELTPKVKSFGKSCADPPAFTPPQNPKSYLQTTLSKLTAMLHTKHALFTTQNGSSNVLTSANLTKIKLMENENIACNIFVLRTYYTRAMLQKYNNSKNMLQVVVNGICVSFKHSDVTETTLTHLPVYPVCFRVPGTKRTSSTDESVFNLSAENCSRGNCVADVIQQDRSLRITIFNVPSCLTHAFNFKYFTSSITPYKQLLYRHPDLCTGFEFAKSRAVETFECTISLLATNEPDDITLRLYASAKFPIKVNVSKLISAFTTNKTVFEHNKSGQVILTDLQYVRLLLANDACFHNLQIFGRDWYKPAKKEKFTLFNKVPLQAIQKEKLAAFELPNVPHTDVLQTYDFFQKKKIKQTMPFTQFSPFSPDKPKIHLPNFKRTDITTLPVICAKTLLPFYVKKTEEDSDNYLLARSYSVKYDRDLMRRVTIVQAMLYLTQFTKHDAVRTNLNQQKLVYLLYHVATTELALVNIAEDVKLSLVADVKTFFQRHFEFVPVINDLEETNKLTSISSRPTEITLSNDIPLHIDYLQCNITMNELLHSPKGQSVLLPEREIARISLKTQNLEKLKMMAEKLSNVTVDFEEKKATITHNTNGATYIIHLKKALGLISANAFGWSVNDESTALDLSDIQDKTTQYQSLYFIAKCINDNIAFFYYNKRELQTQAKRIATFDADNHELFSFLTG